LNAFIVMDGEPMIQVSDEAIAIGQNSLLGKLTATSRPHATLTYPFSRASHATGSVTPHGPDTG
jgi:hypothetical protein